MTSVSKNVYIDKLAGKVNKSNNTYHSTIKMMPVDVKPSTYLDFNNENNKEAAKFEVSDHVRISKYKKISAKCYFLNWWEEVFVIENAKSTVLWSYVISDLNSEEVIRTFYGKNCKKQIGKNLEVKKESREKLINYILNGKAAILLLIVGLIKKGIIVI